MKMIVLAILTITMLASCSSNSYCVKVDGSSDKYGIDNAGVEFCYNPVASDNEQANVFNSATSDDEYFLVHKKYIDRANEIIDSQSPKAAAANTEKQKTMQKFILLTK